MISCGNTSAFHKTLVAINCSEPRENAQAGNYFHFNFIAMHNVQFVKYDVTVSFMAQVIDTVTCFVSHVEVDTVTYFDIF